jgi:exopolyphosphatase/guanosine-5'-triphosphate,3'-diphosphate pyrophosphatase
MERTALVIEDMAGNAFALGADKITAVGTQAMRHARNAGEFVLFVISRCGVEIRVISGEEEAETSFLAALTIPEYAGECLVLDVGGGSSELALGSPAGLAYRCSVPAGALSLHRRFFRDIACGGPVGREVLNEARRFVKKAAENCGFTIRLSAARCVGIGGTVTALASVFLGLCEAERGRADGSVLTAFEIERQIALYASMDSDGRKKIKGMTAGRSDIVLPGACAVKALMDIGGMKSLTVSGRGLRHGLMAKIERTLSGGRAFAKYG